MGVKLEILRREVEKIQKFVEVDSFCQALQFDFAKEHPIAELQSQSQLNAESGFGFGYHNDIQINEEPVLFVEKWKVIPDDDSLEHIKGNSKSFQYNHTYWYAPKDSSNNFSKLKILEMSDYESIAIEIIQFIRANKLIN